MKTLVLSFRRITWLTGSALASLIVAAVVGCSDARWKEANAVRQARITEELHWYSAHDAAGPERIAETMGFAREQAKHRAENLEYTIRLARQMHERDVQRWRDEAPKREAALRQLWNGHPETIPDTWASMVY